MIDKTVNLKLCWRIKVWGQFRKKKSYQNTWEKSKQIRETFYIGEALRTSGLPTAGWHEEQLFSAALSACEQDLYLSPSTEEGGQLATSLNTPVGLKKGAPWQLGSLTVGRAYLLCLWSHINGSLNPAVVWVSNGFFKKKIFVLFYLLSICTR